MENKFYSGLTIFPKPYSCCEANERGSGSTGSGIENWLFMNVYIQRNIWDLYVPQPNTEYSLFVNGVKVATAVSTAYGEIDFQTGVYYTCADGGCWYVNTEGYYSVGIDNKTEVDESWLFKGVPIIGYISTLPAPVPGVSYTVFVNGEEVGTQVADDNGFVYVRSEGGHIVIMGDSSQWGFHGESIVGSGMVSVRIND